MFSTVFLQMRIKDDGKKKPSSLLYRKKLKFDPEEFCKEIVIDLLCAMFPRAETSHSLQGVWLAEQSLGPGWKSCLITPARG